jgi:hypothetical protein
MGRIWVVVGLETEIINKKPTDLGDRFSRDSGDVIG